MADAPGVFVVIEDAPDVDKMMRKPKTRKGL
jgi:hypothetical protein